jgi:hypothetical protein
MSNEGEKNNINLYPRSLPLNSKRIVLKNNQGTPLPPEQ